MTLVHTMLRECDTMEGTTIRMKRSSEETLKEDTYFALALVGILVAGGLVWQGLGSTNEALDQQAAISSVLWDTEAREASREKQEFDAIGADIQEELDALEAELNAE